MSTKIIAISLNTGTPALRNAITTAINGAGWPVWHWQDDFWLTQVPSEHTPKTIHEFLEAKKAVQQESIFLFEVGTPIAFWGREPEAAWEWLQHIGKPG